MFGKADGAGKFETEDACHQKCSNSYGCVENECVQFPGKANPRSINKFNTLQECTADGCGNVTYDCAQAGLCIATPGNDGIFDSEGECDTVCSNSFDCIDNVCTQFAGSQGGPYKTLKECQEKGCGKFYYTCEDQPNGGQKCVRNVGNPPAGIKAYATEAECNANCSNSFNCRDNVCEEVVGNGGEFDTRQSCEESGCGEISYKCVNNRSCVKMNNPVDK
jgi:hypothetical protein